MQYKNMADKLWMNQEFSEGQWNMTQTLFSTPVIIYLAITRKEQNLLPIHILSLRSSRIDHMA